MIKDDIQYIISLPRLAFTDNMFSILESVKSLGLSGRYSMGVFWYQDLERLLEKAMETKAKYALTIDYDTLFSSYHIIDLYEIMEAHPDLIALFPLQPRRGQQYPMAANFVDPNGDEVKISKGDFRDRMAYTDTGHFGLTLIRLSELKKLSKPWLWSHPNKDNNWGRGHKDADVRFWIKCKKEGFKVGLADVYIGHIQLMCAFCGPEKTGFSTRYFPIHTIGPETLPKWTVPKSLKRSSNVERNPNEKRDSGRDKDTGAESPKFERTEGKTSD